MEQNSNSKFLEYIISEAQACKTAADKKILSANYIVIALIRFFSENRNNEPDLYSNKEIDAVKQLMDNCKLMEDAEKKIEALNENGDSYMDDYLLKINMNSAKSQAEKSGECVVSADILLQCIIKNPTDEIKRIIPMLQETQEEKSEEASTKKTGGVDIGSLLSAYKAGSESGEKGSSSLHSERDGEKTKVKERKIDNPLEYINELTAKVRNMRKTLSANVFGQDNAINIFTSGYFQAELRAITDKASRKPRATFLFAGPPGVGKTFLAEKAAELLGLPFKRFDMSEYAEHDAIMELCGTNESYKGAKKGELTGFVDKHPECVLLFDEVEKAHINAIHLFLQMLDAGRLRDTFTTVEVDFSNTYIIFTTNAGRKLYDDSVTTNLSHISRKTILRSLERDVDPKTGNSAFPAAICSRFATGNVIMFNHIEANSLLKIAKKEITRSAEAYAKETGVEFEISDDIFSCVLFSEGGRADARTVKSRASSFFSRELYELFRLLSGNGSHNITDIEKIKFYIALPEDEKVVNLFVNNTKGTVLFLAEPSMCRKIESAVTEKEYKAIFASTAEEAIKIISEDDIEIVFCDLHFKRLSDDFKSLNIEDIYSEGRTFFRYVCEKCDTPLYIISDDEHLYTDEEVFSLTREGARSVIDAADDNIKEIVSDIMVQIHQQGSMTDLARANKCVTYETSQCISDDGKIAEIGLFDIALKITVDAEDTENIMSSLSKPNVRFEDVIGANDAKEELQYFVNYLKNPKKFASKGLGVPKGVLFYGPPGTGKTLLAKAVAGESDVTFIIVEGNQFLKKYVGEGEEKVHNIFATARKYAPAIIFVDEIDAIAKERNGENKSDSILTAFLAEMDGFKSDPKKPVFVLAATNFDVEPGHGKSLDPALVRRFDRHIYIDMPDKEARIKFMKMRLSASALFNISESEIENIAVRSTGMSLAQLEGVFELSKRTAVRADKAVVDYATFEQAFEEFNYGEEKKWDESELKKTAYHEAGHAFLCWRSGETPSYLTIVARGNHGGYMQHGDTEKTGSYTKKRLLDRIRTALGGRAAELVFFGEDDGLTTGPSGDLKTATAIATGMVCDYGMDDSVGPAVITDEQRNGNANLLVRNAVNKILVAELENARRIISENKTAIEKTVEILMEKNHLAADEIDAIFREYTK